MKKIILGIGILVLFFSCGEDKTSEEAKNDFRITGKLSESSGEKIFLEILSPEGVKLVDTASVDEKGEFILTPDSAIETGFYNIKITKANFVTVVLDGKENLHIEGNARDLGNSYKVKGSKDAQLFWELNDVSKNNYRKRDSISKFYQAYINSVKMDQKKIDSLSKTLEQPFNSLVEEQAAYIKRFVDANPSSFVTLAAVQQLDPKENLDYFIKTGEALKQKYPTSPYVQYFLKSVKTLTQLGIGSIAPEITLNTPQDKTLSLSSLKGKVVLIDFWASWCRPCLAQVPDLKKIYDKHSKNGFEIFGVSLDKGKAEWVKAIADYQLNWLHVSDLGYWNSSVVALYDFNSIPLTYLLDKDGKIVAKSLNGEALDKKIEELLATQ